MDGYGEFCTESLERMEKSVMTIKNPYVGPRPFKEEEASLFFGRDREARDLCALVTSVKLALFYAQSGAGKSSLINTRLILELKERGYEVLPVARVGGDAPKGIDTANIYISNLMRSLIKHEIKSDSLVGLSLSEFLAKLNKDENEYFYDSNLTTGIRASEDFVLRRALIIDQFEELFSSHPEAWQSREGFFNQLAQAMQDDPSLWVVLVMREDYIASLDPYVHLLPGGLRTRYYMQRLDKDRAIEAVEGPAATQVHPFAPGVAEKLFDDLSRIQVRKLDGTFEPQTGQYVEPVQLQVICHTLWKNLFPEEKDMLEGIQITEKDLKKIGNVNLALGNFYAARVQEVAEAKGIKERKIREWFTRELISPSGMRNMVLQEPDGNSAGLENEIIQALPDLIRPEQRGGATFYELTHDRMVEPIIQNNQDWDSNHSSPFLERAKEWEKVKEDPEKADLYLMRDQALLGQWKETNPDELTPLETEFLKANESYQRRIRRRRNIYAAIATLIMLLILAFVYVLNERATTRQVTNLLTTAQVANTLAADQSHAASTAQARAVAEKAKAEQEKANAERARDQALAGNLVAQADSLKNSDYSLALLLGIEAYEHDQTNLLTRTTLFQLLQFTPYKRQFEFGDRVTSVAISPDGRIIASASPLAKCTAGQCKLGEISLFDADLKPIGKIHGDYGIVYGLAFHQDEERLILVAGGCVPVYRSNRGCTDNKGQITAWDVTEPENPTALGDFPARHKGRVQTIAFSPDGKLLASGSYDTTIILWNVSDPQNPSLIGKPLGGRAGHSSFVNSLAFSPDGSTLVSAGDDRTIRLWDVSGPEYAAQKGKPLTGDRWLAVNSIAFSPDGKKFASSSNDNTVLLWDWVSGSLENPKALLGHTGYVTSVAFNEDGTRLASAGFDNKILLWDTSTGEQIGPPLSAHSGVINSVSFGHELPYLISGSNDRTLIHWDLSARQPLSYTASISEDELPLDDTEQLTDSNADFTATANGQQIDVTYVGRKEVFLTLGGYDSPVQYVKFDGQDLRTMDQIQRNNRWITSWNINDSDWVGLACQAANRNLTEAEWKQFLPDQPYRKTCESLP
jgi:WD40 repeat protein